MNYQVIAKSGLKVRSGPGTDYDEAAERLLYGDVIIAAEETSPDPTWLPVLLEDDTVAYVARGFVQPVETDYPAIEAVKIQDSPRVDLPIFQNQLTAKYGYPRENAGYLKIIDLREYAEHLARVKEFNGNKWSCRIWGHEAMEAPLNLAFRRLSERGLMGELKTYDGCFNIRKMSSGRSYSVHSWGMAVDFNARENPYGGPVRFSDDLIRCFAESGFEAGALWRTPDGMHFQLPWTQDWRNSDNPLRPV